MRYPCCMVLCLAHLILAIAPNADGRTDELTVGGAGSMIRAARSFSDDFEKAHPGVSVQLAPGSSRSALRGVRTGELDIGLMGHAVEGQDRVGLHIEPIEKQPILLVTYPTNPVTSLSLAQVRAIYVGNTTNWADVGGEDQAIVPFTRRKNSMIRRIFMRTVFDGARPQEKAFRIAKDKVLKTISKIQGALGFASTPLEKARQSGVKVLSVNGKAPTRPNVQRGSYPFSRMLLVIATEPPPPLVLEWMEGFLRFMRRR